MTADALIHLRVPAATKARWVRASRAAGTRLTDWIVNAVEAHMQSQITTAVIPSGLQFADLNLARESDGIEDLDGLPDELIQELSVTDGDRLDFTIYTIIEELGGIASLDQLLIALYRKTGEVHKRPNVNSRLYRLTTRGGELFNVPGKKGVYATHELTQDEIDALG